MSWLAGLGALAGGVGTLLGATGGGGGGGGGMQYSPQEMADTQLSMYKRYMPLLAGYNRPSIVSPTGRQYWTGDADSGFTLHSELDPALRYQYDLGNMMRRGMMDRAYGELDPALDRMFDTDYSFGLGGVPGFEELKEGTLNPYDALRTQLFGDYSDPDNPIRGDIGEAWRRSGDQMYREGRYLGAPGTDQTMRALSDAAGRISNQWALGKYGIDAGERDRRLQYGMNRRNQQIREKLGEFQLGQQRSMMPYQRVMSLMGSPTQTLPTLGSYMPIHPSGAPNIMSAMGQSNQIGAQQRMNTMNNWGQLLGAGAGMLGNLWGQSSPAATNPYPGKWGVGFGG